MRAVVLPLVVLLLLALEPAAAFGQHKGRGQARATSNMSHEERRQLREDVGAARYDRRGDMRRQDRMPPEEREKLRRDVQDANRDIKRK